MSYELAALKIAVKIVELGRVLSTGFVQRSGAEAAAIERIGAYDGALEDSERLFAKLRERASRSTSEQVAEVIYTASTDSSEQLRYVATDDIKPLVAARRGNLGGDLHRPDAPHVRTARGLTASLAGAPE